MPKLEMHECNQQDIFRHVNSKLTSHSWFEELQSRDLVACAELANEIISRSMGVFLWTILVVEAMLTQFNDACEVPDLWHELEQYATNLNDLYGHMLCEMNQSQPTEVSKYS